MSDDQIDVLYVALESGVRAAVDQIVKDVSVTDVTDNDGFEAFLEDPPEKAFFLILCGRAIAELSPVELAQSMRMQYANAKIVYLTENREGYDRKDLIKNGFNDAFLLPFDTSVLKTNLEDVLARAKNLKIFRPVKVMDLQPNSTLDFDVNVYLPMNNKYVRYINEGSDISGDKINKLKTRQMNSVFVTIDQMDKFYDYSATKLIELGNADNDSMSETERKERLESSVRDLFTGIFNTDASQSTVAEGKEFLAGTKRIVETYIEKSNPAEWYTKLTKALGETTDSYSHATNVSTMASLISIGLGQGNPQELAIAGLYHDIGLADVPSEIQSKPEEEWTDDERKLYQMHPEYSVRIIKEKKIIVPASVHTAIAQHHERFDGKGYPNQIAGFKLKMDSQILSLADQLDYLTQFQAGQKRRTPIEFLEEVNQKQNAFQPEFLQKVMVLFREQAGSKSA